jgi:pimeloyl-ACP methyl ester carboxylesterase
MSGRAFDRESTCAAGPVGHIVRVGASRVLVLVVMLLVGVGCTGAGTTAAASGSLAPPSSVSPSASLPPSPTVHYGDTVPGPNIKGLFDVGGHGLYMECRGTGSPTIVYMHGWMEAQTFVPHENGQFAIRALSDRYRVCVYDRRNTASSETVDAPQLPDDALQDMRRLLAAAKVKPPYVLLGASFGGLLSYLYANRYPKEVVGMVLLDAMFPDDLKLDPLWPPDQRYKASSKTDENASLERISQYKVFKACQPYIGDEPAIPVTYLESIQQGVNTDSSAPPAYNRKVLGVLRAYVERFSPGRFIRVNSPHTMETAIPGRIVAELRRVIQEAGY